MRIQEAVSESGGGLAWPVVIVGGLVILTGLVAVRGEFANFRRRRAERRGERP